MKIWKGINAAKIIFIVIPLIMNDLLLGILAGRSRGWAKTGPLQTQIFSAAVLLGFLLMTAFIIRESGWQFRRLSAGRIAAYFALWVLNCAGYVLISSEMYPSLIAPSYVLFFASLAGLIIAVAGSELE